MNHSLNQTILRTLAITFVFAGLLQSASADDKWKQFRGAGQMGIADKSAKPPVKWDLKKNSRWSTKLPGAGWSSPVYDQGKIWLTTAITTKATADQIAKKKKGVQYADIKTVAASVEFRVLCIDMETGKVVHNTSLKKVSSPELINPMNSYASPTAAIADGKVVCHFGNYGTWCLDSKTGKQLWKRQYVVDHSVGPGSSPVIWKKNVILVCDGTDKQFIVAVDLETGKEKWLTKRPPIRQKNPEFQKAYCTPLILKINGADQAVIPGAQWIVAYDPSTGKELWRADHGAGFSVTPMPVFQSGNIVFSTGYGRTEFVAVDPKGSGDVTKTHIKWRRRNAPTMPSFIGLDNEIVAITDRGILVRLDAKTGEVLERMRVGGNFSASPLLAGGHLYLSSREGVMTVIKLGDEFEKVATHKFDSPLMASPVVFKNDLIVRTRDRIYRISK